MTIKTCLPCGFKADKEQFPTIRAASEYGSGFSASARSFQGRVYPVEVRACPRCGTLSIEDPVMVDPNRVSEA
jgi:hypothetical protein